MIDLHSHVLPGLDDGAASLEESLGIARAAAADGTVALAGTPHVREVDYPTAPEAMEHALGAVRAAVAADGIEIAILGGGELALDRLGALSNDDLRRFGLGGSARYVLLEMPYLDWPLELRDRAFELQLRGFTPVLAHPERNPAVQEQPALLAELVQAGVLVQLTAASVDGRGGRRAQKTASVLLDAGLAHLIASDAHAPSVREVGLSSAVAALGDPALATWLTTDVPAAIVAGEPAPARVAAAASRRRWWRRRG